nr:M10 family metallopeptidase C-terminal domain-containing protein [Dickeya dianthicola]
MFCAAVPDWILDFQTGVDKIDLSALNTGNNLHFVNQFSGSGAEALLNWDSSANVSNLYLNLDNNTSPEFLVKIVGQVSQTADFVV